jgi:hypothetical protein
MAALEQDIAFDPEAEGQADRLHFVESEAAQLRRTETKIGETEQDIVFVNFGREPGRLTDWIEEADDGNRIFGRTRAGRRRRCRPPSRRSSRSATPRWFDMAQT